MAAASRGAARVEGHLVGRVAHEGERRRGQSTADLHLALFTGMGKARNVIDAWLTASSAVVVAGAADPRHSLASRPCLNGGRPLILLAVPALWRDGLLLLARRGGGERERRAGALPVDRGPTGTVLSRAKAPPS